MGLPEDDVEEVDPEPAIARILDHDHDAIVLGPGLRPGLADDRARPRAAPTSPRSRRRRRSSSTRRRSARSRRSGEWWDGRHAARASSRRTPASSPGSGPATGVDAEADGDLSADDAARAAAARTPRPAGGRSSCSRARGPSSPRRTARWPSLPVREPGPGHGRARATSSPGSSARCSPRAWHRAGGPARRLPPRPRRRPRPRAARRRRPARLRPARRVPLVRKRLAAIAERDARGQAPRLRRS